jgi:uncharacterized protein (TIGR02145 family)
LNESIIFQTAMKNILRISGVILFLQLFQFCKKDKVPTLTTSEVVNFTGTGATTGGTVTDEGSASVIVRGVCWNTKTNPTIEGSRTQDGAGNGVFTSHITDLDLSATYYIRAYATNSAGTGYGNEIIFTCNFPNCGTVTDADGNIYQTVTIGPQCWMRENLKTTRFNNGDLIGTTISPDLDISGEAMPNYQWAYNGNEEFVSTYGRLYTWFTVTDVRNACPPGWRIPTETDWMNLIEYLENNGYGTSGNAIASSSGWVASSVTGAVGNDQVKNNSSGFTALPAGSRYPVGTFQGLTESSMFGSSSTYSGSTFYYHLDHDSPGFDGGEGGTELAVSERCIMGQRPLCNALPATDITPTGATLNGAVNPNNLSTDVIFQIYTPPIELNQIVTAIQSPVSGTDIINVSADISDLTPGTLYTFRIVATSSEAGSSGTLFQFTTTTGTVADAEGNIYNTISVGTQLWMAENLKATRYRNGDIIGSTTPATLDISGESIPAYQWAYDGDEKNVAAFGRLYTYYAITDSRGVCPTGWHVPADDEWTTLTEYLITHNRPNIAKLMASQSDWVVSPVFDAAGWKQEYNNRSGFSAPPGGYRIATGAFGALGYSGYWLSSTESDTDNVRYRSLNNDEPKVTRYYDSKQAGFSVRCLKANQ